MWHLLFSGAFERFPRLKYVVTEAAAYWAADMMWKWDQYMGGGHTTKKMAALLKGKISKLPSDYFGENIFIGASTMSREEIRRRHVLGCDVVMWGTDYPHPEGTWPHTQERLRGDFGGIPVEDARKLLGETAARCYDFDLDALQPEADRIGPTPAGPRAGPFAAHRSRGGAHGALVEGRVPGPGAGLSVAMNPGHMEYCASDDWRQLVHETILPVALAGVTLGDDAIEIGPGPGFTTDILRTKTAHLTAVELDEGLAAGLAERMAGTNVEVVRRRRHGAGLRGRQRFTGAASFHMLHHIAPAEAQDRVFAELARVLVPGATLVAADGVYSEGRRGLPPGRHLQPASTRRSWSRGCAPPASARCGCARTTSDGCARPD